MRFYSGSESADQRMACAIAQKNVGKQYLVKVLETAAINPGSTINSQMKRMDYERIQAKNLEQTKAFKKRSRQFTKARASKDGFLESREGTAYESGSALTLDPDIMNASSISKPDLCQIKRDVPTNCEHQAVGTSAEVLASYDLNRPTAIAADASINGLGAVLLQVQDVEDVAQ